MNAGRRLATFYTDIRARAASRISRPVLPIKEVGTGRALVAGGGFDRKINERFALRFKADYLQTDTAFPLSPRRSRTTSGSRSALSSAACTKRNASSKTKLKPNRKAEVCDDGSRTTRDERPRRDYDRRSKSLSGFALARSSSAKSAPFSTTSSNRSFASSVQSEAVSRASS